MNLVPGPKYLDQLLSLWDHPQILYSVRLWDAREITANDQSLRHDEDHLGHITSRHEHAFKFQN